MSQSPIHIKLEYEEALNSKKNLLSSQKNLLISLKYMNKYYSLRSEEQKVKTKLHRKMKETLTEIRKIEKDLPKPKITGILQNEDEEKYPFGKKLIKNKDRYDKNIESQLADIQAKLKSLE